MSATARDRAAVVYREVRDAGSAGLSMAEVRELTWLSTAEILETIRWMRVHGVDVVVAPSAVAGEPSRVALRSALPEAWDATV